MLGDRQVLPGWISPSSAKGCRQPPSWEARLCPGNLLWTQGGAPSPGLLRCPQCGKGEWALTLPGESPQKATSSFYPEERGVQCCR